MYFLICAFRPMSTLSPFTPRFGKIRFTLVLAHLPNHGMWGSSATSFISPHLHGYLSRNGYLHPQLFLKLDNAPRVAAGLYDIKCNYLAWIAMFSVTNDDA
jgi:hypothetical protein